MKKCRVMLWIGVLLVTLCWTGTILAAGASENCKHWVGKVVSLQGTVEVRKAGENTWIPVGLNHVLCHGDMMRTQKRSRTSILLSNESSLRLDQMTILTINQEEKKDSFLVDLSCQRFRNSCFIQGAVCPGQERAGPCPAHGCQSQGCCAMGSVLSACIGLSSPGFPRRPRTWRKGLLNWT